MTVLYRWLAHERGPSHAFLVGGGSHSLCQYVAAGQGWEPRAERPLCHWCKIRIAANPGLECAP